MNRRLRQIADRMWHFRPLQPLVPDRLHCLVECWYRTGQILNLKEPRTFNEKIQWLKLYDRNQDYSRIVDKYEVREYAESRIGKRYLIPLIGVYASEQEIPFGCLPSQYVLKCTHDSGTVIVKGPTCTLTEDEIRRRLSKALRRNYYYVHREWPYKGVRPRIVCEQYMVDESNVELKDYKIHCFGGEPRLIQVDFRRFTDHRRNLYDTQWNLLDASMGYPADRGTVIKRPDRLGEMLELASTLSSQFPYIRVDLYVVKASIYFGELTLYHGAGYDWFSPRQLECQMGDWLELPRSASASVR